MPDDTYPRLCVFPPALSEHASPRVAPTHTVSARNPVFGGAISSSRSATMPDARSTIAALVVPERVASAIGRAKALQHRHDLQIEAAVEARFAREASGLTQTELAAAIGMQRPRLTRCENTRERHSFTVEQIARGAARETSRPWAVSHVRWLARKVSHQLIALSKVVDPGNHAARLARVSNESADVIRELVAGVADGRFDVADLERVRKETREMTATSLEVEAWADAEIERLRGVA